MNWLSMVDDLNNGETIQCRPRGNSMSPMIKSGQLVTISPIKNYHELKTKDVVFCKVKGNYYIHLIQAIKQKMGGLRFQIGNYKNKTNGTIGQEKIFGKVVDIGN